MFKNSRDKISLEPICILYTWLNVHFNSSEEINQWLYRKIMTSETTDTGSPIVLILPQLRPTANAHTPYQKFGYRLGDSAQFRYIQMFDLNLNTSKAPHGNRVASIISIWFYNNS